MICSHTTHSSESYRKVVFQIFNLPPFLQTLPYFQVGPAVVLRSSVAPPGLPASSEIHKKIQFHLMYMQITASALRLITSVTPNVL